MSTSGKISRFGSGSGSADGESNFLLSEYQSEFKGFWGRPKW